MKTTYKFNLIAKYIIFNLCFIFLLTNCTQKNLMDTFDNPYLEGDDPVTEGDEPRTFKDITQFDFLKSDNTGLTSDAIGTIDIDNSTINISVPQGFNISGLVPYIINDGVSITPACGTSTDFSGGPVEYTVTAEDNTQKIYSVTVDNGPPEAPGAPADTVLTYPMTIYLTGGTESDFKEFRLSLTGTPPGNCSQGFPAQVDTPIDIPSTITLKAIACDNFGNASAVTTREYTYMPLTEKDIVIFKFRKSDNPGLQSDIIGAINESTSTIDLTVPNGTNTTNLVPYIEHTGHSVFPNSGAGQDFSAGTITYQVYAEDSSTKNYYVNVNIVINNLVQNGSFEYSDPFGWNNPNMANFTVSNVEKTDGIKSMSLYNDGSSSINPLSQDITLTPGTDYTLSMSMKLSSDTVSGSVVFDTNDIFDNPGQCQFVLADSHKGTWKNYSCTFNSGSYSFIKLRFFQHQQELLTGTAYLDNVILTEVP